MCSHYQRLSYVTKSYQINASRCSQKSLLEEAVAWITLTAVSNKTMYLQFLRCDRHTGATKFEVLLEICPTALENFVSVPAIAASLLNASFNVPQLSQYQLLGTNTRESARAQRDADALLPTALVVSLRNRILILAHMTKRNSMLASNLNTYVYYPNIVSVQLQHLAAVDYSNQVL